MARKPHSSSLVLLLVCIFAFWWGISVLAQGTDTTIATFNANQAQGASTLSVHQTQSGNTYTYSGSVAVAACQVLGSGVRVAGAGADVTLLLTTTSVDTSDCAQAAGNEPQSFSVSVTHQGGAPSFEGVLLNGQPAVASVSTE